MQVKCLSCSQALRVKDELVGRKARCPKCGSVLRLGARRAAPPPRAAAAPERQGPRLAEQPAPEPQAARRAAAATGAGPRCYLTKDSDEEDAVSRVFTKVREVFPGEELEYQFVDYDAAVAGPPQLRAQDIHVTATVLEADYGSRLVRYFLTPLSLLFGLGACKLHVAANLTKGDGSSEDFQVRARQGVGIFGGSADGLMELNLKAAENGLAAKVSTALTGRRITSFGAARLGKAALVCGLFGLIPFLSFFLFLPTLLMGGIATWILSSRGVSQGKTKAITGTVLGVADLAVSALSVLFLTQLP